MTASVNYTLELLHINKVRTIYAHMFDTLMPLKDQAANFHRLYLEGKFERVSLDCETFDAVLILLSSLVYAITLPIS